MPKRKDLKKIMIIGAGPIVIGQACEFDYSGSQACKALKEEGYSVVLVNSNPATIMTDVSMADKVYIEPITPEIAKKIIIKEKPDALLPTVGGQTGLNVSVKLAEDGFLKEHNVELIGANLESIKKAEDRLEFKKAMDNIGLEMTKSGYAYSLEDARKILEDIDFPVIIRSSFTLGGTGGSVAYNLKEFDELVQKALDLSMINEITIEESIIGWKEYELEVMRDNNDNVVIICSIENLDPMGIHTGDSITVAPQQTLSDKEYQTLRDMSIKIIREIGVDTGGSNIQFAVNPDNGRIIVIEMNPRVSRSSALASKATGFPIAKIAAKLAVGYTLDEIPNDITKETPASFEPTIDYVVTKIPRFAFEKFKSAEPNLGIQMKSVGETMSIGRTFKESFQKGLRGLEIKKDGFDGIHFNYENKNRISDIRKKEITEDVINKLKNNNSMRIFYIKDAFFLGMTIDDVFGITKIDKWFLHNLKDIFDLEQKYYNKHLKALDKDDLKLLKSYGFSDKQIAYMTNTNEREVRNYRKSLDIINIYKFVDTCAGEFEAKTPYYYSSYDQENDTLASTKKKIMILGGGPNRIGQGIEFDYMCVHASYACKKENYETIMVNSNPETVSTDYDTSDKLYFEPLTFEDVMNIVEKEKPEGIIVQFGGQTPLNLSKKLEAAGVKILGTQSESIDIAEDRDRFKLLLEKLNYLQPKNDTAYSYEEAKKIANNIGYPVVVRPSYVLGGRAMEIVFSDEELDNYMTHAIKASPEHPILIDKYLENAVEIDVDAVCDSEQVFIAGIMEHIEEAGIHSGDSACILPAYSLSDEIIDKIKQQTIGVALELKVKGLLNIQFAVKDNELYFLEVNPRGSRTVPFVSKATGIPVVKIATQVILGKKLKDIDIPQKQFKYYSIKEAVLPFNKFPGEDIILGPEMKSTGEAMGIDKDFGIAFAKSQMSAGSELPKSGGILITVNNDTKNRITEQVEILKKLGFDLYATEGTYEFFKQKGIEMKQVYKYKEGRPDISDVIINNKIKLIFNTPVGKKAKTDDRFIRKLSVQYKIPIMTTVSAMKAATKAIVNMQDHELTVLPLDELYQM